MKVVIFGAGNLGLAIAHKYAIANHQVMVFSRKSSGTQIINSKQDDLGLISSTTFHLTNEDTQLNDADLIILCGPGTAYDEWFGKIKDIYSKTICSVIGSNGLFESAHKSGIDANRLLVFQRVPYICRSSLIDNGNCKSIITGHKKCHKVYSGSRSDLDLIRILIDDAEIKTLSSEYSVRLSNSNPLLHTSRLFDLGDKVYDDKVKFYSDWNDNASFIYLSMDEELMKLRDKLNIPTEELPSVKDYYEVNNKEELTHKLRSITAFKDIYADMILTNKGYKFDFNSRYFTEDFPISLANLVSISDKYGIECPNMKRVLKWGLSIIKKYNL